jgi:hypothetical protein
MLGFHPIAAVPLCSLQSGVGAIVVPIPEPTPPSTTGGGGGGGGLGAWRFKKPREDDRNEVRRELQDLLEQAEETLEAKPRTKAKATAYAELAAALEAAQDASVPTMVEVLGRAQSLLTPQQQQAYARLRGKVKVDVRKRNRDLAALLALD